MSFFLVSLVWNGTYLKAVCFSHSTDLQKWLELAWGQDVAVFVFLSVKQGFAKSPRSDVLLLFLCRGSSKQQGRKNHWQSRCQTPQQIPAEVNGLFEAANTTHSLRAWPRTHGSRPRTDFSQQLILVVTSYPSKTLCIQGALFAGPLKTTGRNLKGH